ncbi:c-type cytochrome [Pseudidiomarina terrestris]|uniref:Cytochrome c n=1 Tax=Pseudidiomarina terrestris TaxID=2820060 RepID=A0AAW7QYF5_9GAMM|nr:MULTISPECIES: cytochrome c [unclassified Pseudidiomarina]MDN7123888.1 cytochrome c [Pseudidiomarina sp. 1APP75-32.1]MDN7127642.1 cytochrome c [Pseudidiomarina sp. 1APR75-33.1]MDN7130388.1 cytochrome c [Pseudidiomarina sp. 1APR75-15]MDN7136311.1 cytochrome c [Pseudidiomarina sp. 1ASP75-5]MDN7138772.1 cytochrome c [Pseudidiomarina sp. 1ASP75-14]
MFSKAIRTSLIVAATLASATVVAQHAFNDADKAVEYRQKALSVMQNNFAYMGDMLKGDMPFDLSIFNERAEVVAKMASVPWVGFAQEGAMPGANTDALPAIWDNWEDFQERAQQLQTDADNLLAAARTGDQQQMRDAFMTTAKSCKGCHDQYKD